MVWLVENVLTLLRLFGQVATNEPVAPLLLLVSASILVTAIAVVGYLAAGGALSVIQGA